MFLNEADLCEVKVTASHRTLNLAVGYLYTLKYLFFKRILVIFDDFTSFFQNFVNTQQ